MLQGTNITPNACDFAYNNLLGSVGADDDCKRAIILVFSGSDLLFRKAD